MAIKRYIPFILLNIIISAAVVLGVLYLWELNRAEEEEVAEATSVAATAPVATAAAVATASAPPPTPPSPEHEEVRHIVKAGETLGNIAELYDVPMDDIIQVNNIANPNYLSIGTELIIPVGGIPTETPEPVSYTHLTLPTN